jgi:hypothetical protein
MLALGCSVSDAKSPGAAGQAGQSCDSEWAAFANALEAPASCVKDSDCAVYTAQCLQVESGNCAGIFRTNTASVATADGLKADYEACIGVGCNAGGSCGLGPTEPKCVSGMCD